MRQITRQAVNNFWSRNNFKLSNTQVITKNDITSMYLWNNKIAELTATGELYFTCAGWNTPTTLERLRGLGLHITKKQGRLFYNGVEFTADEIVKA